MKIYAIYHTIRTGSTLLCEYLRGTGIAGNPVDFCSYHAEFFIPNCRHQKPMTREFIESAIAEYSTPNGVFGLKLQYMQYEKFIKDNTLEELFPSSPIKIYLTRQDKLKQAISATRAMMEGGKYYSFQQTQPVFAPHYQKSLIDQMLYKLAEQEAELQSYIQRNNFQTLNITYEELIENPSKIVMSILDYIGIEHQNDIDLVIPRVSKQADKLNDEWETLYKE